MLALSGQSDKPGSVPLPVFLLDCVFIIVSPVWFPILHLCLFVFLGMMIKQELTSSIRFKFHWEPSAVRQPYLISHLLLQIKIHVRVHKTWCFSFVMRIQLKSHHNESHPPLVFMKNLYYFLSGESQWFHLVHIAPFIFILLWHYVNSLKPTSHNLWLHCLCPLQLRTVQCSNSLLYGRERHSFWWNTGTLVETLAVPHSLKVCYSKIISFEEQRWLFMFVLL